MIRSFFLRIVSLIVGGAMLLLVAPGVKPSQPYDVKDPDECRLCLTVLSDVHVEGNNYPRDRVVADSFKDFKNNVHGSDALLFLGDSTMNGQHIENMILHGMFSLLVKDQRVIPVAGNHDFGNGEGNFEKIQRRWYDYNKAFFDVDLDKPYYSTVVNGFLFIVLANEQQDIETMHMSEEQYEWLEETLAEADGSGLPVFVLAHYPPNWSAPIDPDSTYDLRAILAPFNRNNDLFYLCGHLHVTPGGGSFPTWNGFPTAYIPSLTKLDENGQIFEETGYGEMLEVYPDRVVFRIRNFYRGEWGQLDGAPFEREYLLKNPITTR